jgi:hypothetical protein
MQINKQHYTTMKKSNKRLSNPSILREIQMKKLITQTSLDSCSSSSLSTIRNTASYSTDISSQDSYQSNLETKSTTTATLMKLMHDDNNACVCAADLLGMEDAYSLASDHGLMDVKEESYWFDEDEDDDYNGHSSEGEESEDASEKSETSTKICEQECDIVVEAVSSDSQDSLINGLITIDLQPKVRVWRDEGFVDKTLECDVASSASDSTASTTEKETTQHADMIETMSESVSESSDEEKHAVDNLERKDSNSSEETNQVPARAPESLSVFVPHNDHDNGSVKQIGDVPQEFSASPSSKSKASNQDEENQTISKHTSHKTKVRGSTQKPPRKQSSGYISPRQQLAHKCLQDALKVIQREDAANASMNTSMSREELHSLTNVGCVMMLKKKERERGREKQDGRECELELEKVVPNADEQRDDRSTTAFDDDEAREDIELDVVHSGGTVGAPSLVSYIGTIAGSSIIKSYSIESNNESPLDPPSADSLDDSDSQLLQVESDSTAGLSYIGTAVMQDTSLTALNSEDKVADVPQYNASCEKKKLLQEDDMDLMQVETTPTDDETISLDVAASQSFGSVARTPKMSCEDNVHLHNLPSVDSIDEKDDTLSPLPPLHKLGRAWYSPARSYATSLAASSASTSVSDVFGMLRTSLNPNSHENEEMIASSSSAEENEEMLTADLSLLKQDMTTLTSRGGLSKKKRSKSMTSMHMNMPGGGDVGGLTLGNALMATNIFTPPRSKTKSLSNSTPSSAGALYSKRSEQEFNYGSIGATTFSPLRTQQPPSRPQSVVFGAVTSPTPSMFSGYTEIHEQRTFLSIAKDIETNLKSQPTITTPVKKDEMKVLALAEEMVSDEISDTGSDDSSLMNAQVAEALLRESIAKKKSSGLQNYLDGNESDATELYDRVKWLEKVLGVGCGGANRAFENEISNLKEKLRIVEQRLEEEMELKSAADKTVQTLQAKLGGLSEEQALVDKCLRNEVSSLKSQLRFEKIKTETAESDVKAALSSVLDLGLACEEKDEEIAELTKAKQRLLKRQEQLESDLVSCAQSNDELRARVLALANIGSTKEYTLISALAELKTLSENMYHVQKQLDEEKKGRRDEVEALQFSCDDMSKQVLNMSKNMHTLESENDTLRMEVKRLRAEREQTQRMRRSARGF